MLIILCETSLQSLFAITQTSSFFMNRFSLPINFSEKRSNHTLCFPLQTNAHKREFNLLCFLLFKKVLLVAYRIHLKVCLFVFRTNMII